MGECNYILPDYEAKCDNGLSQLEWHELKALLKQEEFLEHYEYCREIQNEIDLRVGKNPC